MSLIRLPKHYKETVISKPNAIANGLADAAQTATKFITDISGSGIWVTPDGAQPSESGSALPTTTGWHISDAIELFKQGASYFKIWLENSVTKVRVGLDSSGHALFTPDGMDILTNATNRIARFGVLTWQELFLSGGSTTDTITGPGVNLSDGVKIVSSTSSTTNEGVLVSEVNDKTIPSVMTVAAVNERKSSGVPKYVAYLEASADENGQGVTLRCYDDVGNASGLRLNAQGPNYISTSGLFEIVSDDGITLDSDTNGSGYIRDTTISADWTINGSTITATTHTCRRSGNVVTITGIAINFGRTFSSGDSVTVGTVPAAYRPTVNTYAQAFYGSGDLGSCYFRLDTSGSLTFNAVKSLTSTSLRGSFTMTFVV